MEFRYNGKDLIFRDDVVTLIKMASGEARWNISQDSEAVDLGGRSAEWRRKLWIREGFQKMNKKTKRKTEKTDE